MDHDALAALLRQTLQAADGCGIHTHALPRTIVLQGVDIELHAVVLKHGRSLCCRIDLGPVPPDIRHAVRVLITRLNTMPAGRFAGEYDFDDASGHPIFTASLPDFGQADVEALVRVLHACACETRQVRIRLLRNWFDPPQRVGAQRPERSDEIPSTQIQELHAWPA